jgi:hypothetical protein
MLKRKLESENDEDDNKPNGFEEDDIQCDGIGEILNTDEEGRKFYAAYQTCDLAVKLGDCVRINLESSDSSKADGYQETEDNEKAYEASFGFAQVLAIFETKDEEMLIEIRWFIKPSEPLLNSKNK